MTGADFPSLGRTTQTLFINASHVACLHAGVSSSFCGFQNRPAMCCLPQASQIRVPVQGSLQCSYRWTDRLSLQDMPETAIQSGYDL